MSLPCDGISRDIHVLYVRISTCRQIVMLVYMTHVL